MAIQTSGLTINQEKQIRELRRQASPLAKSERATLPIYERLARAVAHYRRAQRLTTGEAAELRKEFLTEIDMCLERLGMK